MSQKKEVLIFTDLDGSLLNNETFNFDEMKKESMKKIFIFLKECMCLNLIK